MVMMVLWGHISPQLLQKVMSLYLADLGLHDAGCLDVNGIRKLAKMGSDGIYSQNIWRDFKALLPAPKLPKPLMLKFPVKHTSLGKIVASIPLLLPHTLFSAIYTHYPLMWERIVCPGKTTCGKFWRAVQGSPQFASHPVRLRSSLSLALDL